MTSLLFKGQDLLDKASQKGTVKVTTKQTAKQAVKAIKSKHGDVEPDGWYYHRFAGIWSKCDLSRDTKRAAKNVYAKGDPRYERRQHIADKVEFDTVGGKKKKVTVPQKRTTKKTTAAKKSTGKKKVDATGKKIKELDDGVISVSKKGKKYIVTIKKTKDGTPNKTISKKVAKLAFREDFDYDIK